MNNEKDIDLESLYEYGKFSVKEKNERRGRNPATGEDLMLNARRIVTFRCSSVMRDNINGKG
jgi:integration host factor subunit alpha